MNINILDNISKESLLKIISECTSLQECLIKLNLSVHNKNRQKLKEKILNYNIKTNFSRMYDRDLVGKKFGIVTVLKMVNKNGKKRWLCECECGIKKEFLEYKLLNNIIKSCGCKHYPQGKNNHNWKGCGDISGKYLYSLKNNAKKRNYIYEIDDLYLVELFKKQNGKCAISGVEISLDSQNMTASLDRIDNNKGYVKNNIHWVHKHINIMKNVFTLEYFIDMCKKITKLNEQGFILE